eukprot:163782_1
MGNDFSSDDERLFNGVNEFGNTYWSVEEVNEFGIEFIWPPIFISAPSSSSSSWQVPVIFKSSMAVEMESLQSILNNYKQHDLLHHHMQNTDLKKIYPRKEYTNLASELQEFRRVQNIAVRNYI